MRHLKKLSVSLAFCALAWAGGAAMAADHLDSPAVQADPAADITDLYAWMSPDASKLNLVMDVFPAAGQDAAFSDAIVYAFHVNSSQGYMQAQTETLILCSFPDATHIECWAGDEYVAGETGVEAGLTSESGGLRVFAGPRNDPFFFELNGFNAAVTTVVGAAPGLTFDDAGCPQVDAATSTAIVGLLQSNGMGGPAADFFANHNILSIVIQVDKSVVTPGGPILSVWSSTHALE